MNFLVDVFESLPEFGVVTRCAAARTPMAVTGLSHIHKAALLFALCRTAKHPALLLCGDEGECSRFLEDLTAMGLKAAVFPARDLAFRPVEGVSREFEHQRLSVLCGMMKGRYDVVLTTPDAAILFTMPPEELLQRTRELTPGMTFPVKEAAEALLAAGYRRYEQIDGMGQFSIRGGIIDFFPAGAALPVRLELWGDEIDTITSFSIESQRRVDILSSAFITPATETPVGNPRALALKLEKLAGSLRGKMAATARGRLTSDAQKLKDGVELSAMDAYLPLLWETPATLFDFADGMLFCVSDPVKVKERVRTSQWQLQEDIKGLLEEGVLCRSLTEFTMDPGQLLAEYQNRGVLFLDAFARTAYDMPLGELVTVQARQLSLWGGSLDILLEDLDPLLHQKKAVAVLAGTERAAKNLADDLVSRGLAARFLPDCDELQPGVVTVLPGGLSAGMEVSGAAIITHGRAGAAAKPRKRRHKGGAAIQSVAELTPGDYVVHITHGIGIFEGIHKLEIQGLVKDYIKIRYDKGDTLYVPVTQLDLVSKYIGPKEDSLIKLNRLGGAEWQKTRSRVRKAVKDMAKELIKLYSERMQVKGHSFDPDTDLQNDFERRFAYEETEDQLRCIEEIKGDMEREVPMDRLLCGDVGFGKTEVALRAAFKCVDGGMQCAILVPTTILAWQHYQTILSRFEGFPVKAEVLSRYRTPKQQENIIAKLRRGEIDIIVGTHRLISKDVTFKRLGLVIVDEEQRFGVAQKERLKEALSGVDCLTLSATPIPRTLNMAMSGIRDMSVIEEAPQDRRPVQTYVLEHDQGVLDDAIRRELRRGGQVYYLHNHVESIEGVAARLSQRIPEARVGVAHGKMTEEQLSEVWSQLLENEIDVLVCTTIIETGVDVPNANTLIIENADRMGLSQLHQLRGRVGRSSRRAFAYLTFVRGKVLTDIATKRLNAIREFTEFGAGFKIAMRDLEIRGAGNILGAEQHGHMEAVGYDMYLKLLNEAVREEKGEAPESREDECLVDLQVEAHIPERYIQSSQQRLYVYRRIADIRSQEDASDVFDELIDRFGEIPPAVEGLVSVALARSLAAAQGIYEISQKGDSLLLYMRKLDLQAGSAIAARLKGRVMLNAGQKPYLQVKMEKGQSPLDCLGEVFGQKLS